MRRLTAGILVSGLMLTAVSAPLAGQGRRYFGVGGGLSIPTGDYGNATKLGWVGQLMGGFTTSGGLLRGTVVGSTVAGDLISGQCRDSGLPDPEGNGHNYRRVQIRIR